MNSVYQSLPIYPHLINTFAKIIHPLWGESPHILGHGNAVSLQVCLEIGEGIVNEYWLLIS